MARMRGGGGGGGGDDEEEEPEQSESSSESSSSPSVSSSSRYGRTRGYRRAVERDSTSSSGSSDSDSSSGSSGPSRRGDDRLDAPGAGGAGAGAGTGAGDDSNDPTGGDGSSAEPTGGAADRGRGDTGIDVDDEPGRDDLDESSDSRSSSDGGSSDGETSGGGPSSRSDPSERSPGPGPSGIDVEDSSETESDSDPSDGYSRGSERSPGVRGSGIDVGVTLPGYHSDDDTDLTGLEETGSREEDLTGLEGDSSDEGDVVANQIADRVLDENPNLDRSDFAVRRTDEGYEVEWNEHMGETAAIETLEQNVRERFPTITEDDYAIRGGEDGYTVDIDQGFRENVVADQFRSENPHLTRGDEFVVESAEDGDISIALTDEGQREEISRQVAASDPDLDPDDVIVEDGYDDPGNVRTDDPRHAQDRFDVRYSDDYLHEQAVEQIEENVPDATSEDYDVIVSDGAVSVSFDEDFQRDQIRRNVAESNENIDEDDIAEVVRRGPDSVEDLRAGQTASFSYGIELTEDKQRELLREQAEEEYPDANVEIVLDDDGDLTAQIDGQESTERFGDFAIPVPGTDKRVEDYLEAGAQTWSEFAEGVGEGVAVPVTLTEGAINADLEQLGGKSIGDVVTGAAEGTSVEDLLDLNDDRWAPREGDDGDIQPAGGEGIVERSVEGLGSSAVKIFNVPGVALGLKEGVEYVGYAASETAQGRGGIDVSVTEGETDVSEGQVAFAPNLQEGTMQSVDVDVLDEGVAPESGRAAKGAAIAARDYVTKNPFRSIGEGAGSLVASYAAISKASQISSRAGRATATVIQPGEEALTYAVNRLPGASRVAQRFPNNRIDNEEIFIEAGNRAIRKAQPAVRAARRAKYDLQQRLTPEVRRFMRDEGGQADLTGPGGARQIETGGGSGRAVEIDDSATYADFETELRDEELSQTQEMLRENAEAELEARRSQFDDMGAEMSPSRVEDALTMDPDDITEVRRGRGRSRRPYRGGEPAEDAGMAWEGWSARQVEMEAESEVAAAAGGYGRMEFALEDEMADAEMTMMEELDQRIEAQQQALEGADSEVLDGGMESEFEAIGETELALEAEAEAELELDQEFEQEFEQEYEQAVEQEFEYEFEMELEMETETEAESGWDDDPVTNQEEEILLDAAMDSDEWGTGFASADELLGDLSGDFDPFDEEMI